MLRILIVANLAAYALVVSQPVAYLFFLTRAQRALSAAAYVELRQRINAVMNRRVPVAYGAALVTLLALLAAALRAGSGVAAGTAAIALLCLVLDLVLMMRENLPINGVIDGWSIAAIPEDWEQYRERWFAIFGWRQALLVAGFLTLLVGAAYHP